MRPRQPHPLRRPLALAILFFAGLGISMVPAPWFHLGFLFVCLPFVAMAIAVRRGFLPGK